MNLQDNEQPRGPSMEIKSKYRDAFLSKTLGQVIIGILVFSVGFTMAAVKESRDATTRLHQQSRDIAELKNLLTMKPHGLAETRELKNEITQLVEIQSQKMNDSELRIDQRFNLLVKLQNILKGIVETALIDSNKQDRQLRNLELNIADKRLLIQVPLTLMISAEDAHALMTTGDIMHDEYTKFAQGFHNTLIVNIISQFMQCEKAFLFNLHYLNRKRGLQFESRFVDTILISKNTSKVCTYTSIDGYTWDRSPNLDQIRFTAIFTLDKWCSSCIGGRRCSNINGSPNVKNEMTIMEIC